MNLLFLVLFLIRLTLGSPQQKDIGNDVKLLNYKNEPFVDNSYKYSYEISDGQKRSEEGEIKYIGDKNPLLVVRGSYSFIADDGIEYKVNYIADEAGFRAIGDHIPGVKSKIEEKEVSTMYPYTDIFPPVTLPPYNLRPTQTTTTKPPIPMKEIKGIKSKMKLMYESFRKGAKKSLISG